MVKLTKEEVEKLKKEEDDTTTFDVDAFLQSIPRPIKKPKQTKLKYQPQCPRCLVDLKRGVAERQDGTEWKYYRCPVTRFDTKCYITCGADQVGDYLQAVQEQTHPCYTNIPPEKFRCECNMSMILAMSKSEKNPGRLYLKCPKKSCNLFQWIDKVPKGLAKEILLPELE